MPLLPRSTVPTFVAALSLLAAAASAVHAQWQESDQDPGTGRSPEAVARMALDALDDMRWNDIVDLVHPEAIQRIRERELRHLRIDQRMLRRPKSPQRDPEMPEAVLHWFQEQARRSMEQRGPRVQRVYGLGSVDQLEALPPRELVVRWLDANDSRREMWRQLEAHQPERLRNLDIVEDFRVERHVLGSVLDGDSIARVLYRQGATRSGAQHVEQRTGIVTLRHDGDRWLLWPTIDDRGLFGGSESFALLGPVLSDPAAVAERVVAWPDDERPRGRAYIVGFTNEEEPPRGLVAEGVGADGETVRVEVPITAFVALIEIMQHWAYWP